MLFNSGNECPKPYVLWTAYGLLSAAASHGIFYEEGQIFVRCDTYIILVGTSGSRKTSAVSFGLQLLRKAIPDISISGDNETYQSILTYLASPLATRSYDFNGQKVEYKPYNIFADELMDYIQNNPIGIVKFLTAVYGKPSYIYRLKNEDIDINHPYVTMLSGCVPDWFSDQIQAKQFSEGYGRRSIIICHEGITRKKPVFTAASKHAEELCIQRLSEIRQLIGRMTLDKDADDFFWHWYTTQKDPPDRFLKNWYSSRHINLLKIAMLTSLSERNDLKVTLNDVKLALGLINEVEHNIPLITAKMGRSETNAAAMLIINLLRENDGRMLECDLKKITYKEFKNGLEQFATIRDLQQTQQIVCVTEKVENVDRRFVYLPKIK